MGEKRLKLGCKDKSLAASSSHLPFMFHLYFSLPAILIIYCSITWPTICLLRAQLRPIQRFSLAYICFSLIPNTLSHALLFSPRKIFGYRVQTFNRGNYWFLAISTNNSHARSPAESAYQWFASWQTQKVD